MYGPELPSREPGKGIEPLDYNKHLGKDKIQSVSLLHMNAFMREDGLQFLAGYILFVDKNQVEERKRGIPAVNINYPHPVPALCAVTPYDEEKLEHLHDEPQQENDQACDVHYGYDIEPLQMTAGCFFNFIGGDQHRIQYVNNGGGC